MLLRATRTGNGYVSASVRVYSEILDALISRESLPLLRYRRRMGLISKS